MRHFKNLRSQGCLPLLWWIFAACTMKNYLYFLSRSFVLIWFDFRLLSHVIPHIPGSRIWCRCRYLSHCPAPPRLLAWLQGCSSCNIPGAGSSGSVLAPDSFSSAYGPLNSAATAGWHRGNVSRRHKLPTRQGTLRGTVPPHPSPLCEMTHCLAQELVWLISCQMVRVSIDGSFWDLDLHGWGRWGVEAAEDGEVEMAPQRQVKARVEAVL